MATVTFSYYCLIWARSGSTDKARTYVGPAGVGGGQARMADNCDEGSVAGRKLFKVRSIVSVPPVPSIVVST